MKSKQLAKFKPRALYLVLTSVVAVGSAALSVNSYAATANGTFAVTANVAASCTIVGTALDFGASVNVLGGDVDGTSTLTATCTNGAMYTIGLNAGLATGATVTTRQMVNGADTLNYALYTTTGRTTNWDDIGGTTVVSGTGSGVGQDITVYGRIPSGQTGAKALLYSDTITATIDF
jgi:spore coat protein U-like protein